MEADPFVREFPPHVLKIIDRLAEMTGTDRDGALIKIFALAILWMDAQDNNRIWMEHPQSGEGEEYIIDLRTETE
jgi:flagellar biosynthesis/type III secretory pathway ATPase